MFGRGVAQDSAEGIRLARIAAEQGDPGGLLLMGLAHERGLAVAQSVNEAKIWYRRAAERGSNNAKAALQRLGD
jgi:TPR repeat protein